MLFHLINSVGHIFTQFTYPISYTKSSRKPIIAINVVIPVDSNRGYVILKLIII